MRFRETLSLSGIGPTVVSIGDAYDNALVETTIGSTEANVSARISLSPQIAEHPVRRRTQRRRLRRLVQPEPHALPAPYPTR